MMVVRVQVVDKGVCMIRHVHDFRKATEITVPKKTDLIKTHNVRYIRRARYNRRRGVNGSVLEQGV